MTQETSSKDVGKMVIGQRANVYILGHTDSGADGVMESRGQNTFAAIHKPVDKIVITGTPSRIGEEYDVWYGGNIMKFSTHAAAAARRPYQKCPHCQCLITIQLSD